MIATPCPLCGAEVLSGQPGNQELYACGTVYQWGANRGVVKQGERCRPKPKG